MILEFHNSFHDRFLLRLLSSGHIPLYPLAEKIS